MVIRTLYTCCSGKFAKLTPLYSSCLLSPVSPDYIFYLFLSSVPFRVA
ncbi:hypothetical protein JLBYU28_46 [Escherichia phage JLBYU28]|uniref:Uncharacterized protein n=1 Tax=Escherichia phage JLBYU28 TaxID=2894744 RepID=A0AAE8YWJ5_9CAUD|nr:hypothetical protein JLBYU28_46 [Escherichia phage JLBYU28]